MTENNRCPPDIAQHPLAPHDEAVQNVAEQRQRTKGSGPRELEKSTCVWTRCLEKQWRILESRIERRMRFQCFRYLLSWWRFGLGGFYHPRSFEAHWNKYLKHDPHAADHEGNHLSSSTPTGYKNWSNRPHLSIVSKLGSSGSRASPLWVSKVWYLTKSSNSTDPPWNLRHQTQLSNVFNLHDNHKLSSSLIPSNHPKARSKSKITNLGRSLSSGWWSWQKWICPYPETDHMRS